VYLTKEEVNQFLSAIIGPGERWDETPVARLRFRALVEMLLGTGARISEILSLDRREVDSQTREVTIVGKGRKQRVLFFTDRALGRCLRDEVVEDRGEPVDELTLRRPGLHRGMDGASYRTTGRRARPGVRRARGDWAPQVLGTVPARRTSSSRYSIVDSPRS
jgi:integrase